MPVERLVAPMALEVLVPVALVLLVLELVPVPVALALVALELVPELVVALELVPVVVEEAQ